jgi:hypothetical protein
MAFYSTRARAQEVCDAMNAKLDKRTTPYTVHECTAQN